MPIPSSRPAPEDGSQGPLRDNTHFIGDLRRQQKESTMTDLLAMHDYTVDSTS
jgi:hypothetical protein